MYHKSGGDCNVAQQLLCFVCRSYQYGIESQTTTSGFEKKFSFCLLKKVEKLWIHYQQQVQQAASKWII